MKNIPTFASELSLPTTNSALVEAAFFVIAWFLVVIDCCTLSGSRFIALLSLANDGFSSLFLYHTFLISQKMPTTVRNAGKAKHSTLTGAPCGAKSARIPAITVRAGKVNRPEHLLLGEVLNYIDTAGSRQLQVIYRACNHLYRSQSHQKILKPY